MIAKIVQKEWRIVDALLPRTKQSESIGKHTSWVLDSFVVL